MSTKEGGVNKIKRLLLALVFLVLTVAVLLFVLENQDTVGLVFLGFSLPLLPVSALLIAALLVGLLFGPVVSLLVVKRRRRKNGLKLRDIN
jgi:putative membrane protein